MREVSLSQVGKYMDHRDRLSLTLVVLVALLGSPVAFAQDDLVAKRNADVLNWDGVSISKMPQPGVFFAEYLPKDIDVKPSSSVPILVTLHGSHGSALAELRDWYTYAEQGGFAILSLQWWLGEESYLPPEYVFRLIDFRLHQLEEQHKALRTKGNMFVGFSRGATYMPAMALLDKQTGKDMFSMFMLNAGAWPPNNPPPYMRTLERPGYSYSGKHFCAYYGDKDEFKTLPGQHGRAIQHSIEAHGGKFDLFLSLPDGRHATFVHDPQMVEQVLQAWNAVR